MIKEGFLRVSDVISPFTGVEFVNPDLLIPAAERGVAIHSYIESYFKIGDAFVFEDNLRPYYEAFEDFWKRHSHQFGDECKVITEQRLYCEKLQITGAVDAIVVTPSKTYVFDWKTSSRPQKHWALQGSAYRYLLEQNGYTNVENPTFVRLQKTGKFSLTQYSHHEAQLDIFMKCLELYRWFDMSNTRINLLVTED